MSTIISSNFRIYSQDILDACDNKQKLQIQFQLDLNKDPIVMYPIAFYMQDDNCIDAHPKINGSTNIKFKISLITQVVDLDLLEEIIEKYKDLDYLAFETASYAGALYYDFKIILKTGAGTGGTLRTNPSPPSFVDLITNE